MDVLLLKTRDCPLCDDALKLLRGRAGRFGLRLRVEDISDKAALTAAYGEQVPVVFIEGRRRFFGRVDPILLAREVEAARTLLST